MKGLDYYTGILEHAGADPYAPEGSEQWALAQVASELVRLRILEAGASLTDVQRAEVEEAASGC